MAKTLAVKEYAADMDVTSAGSTDKEIINAVLDGEIIAADEEYISPSTRAEMEAGAARLSQYVSDVEAE